MGHMATKACLSWAVGFHVRVNPGITTRSKPKGADMETNETVEK